MNGTFYTNVAVKGTKILLKGFENGEPFKRRIDYKPHLFFLNPKSTTPYKTLDGKSVDIVEYDSVKEARNFYDANKGGMSIYGMNNFVYPYIYENYPEKIEYDPSMIRVGYLDIEVSTDGGFPDVEKAENYITAISILVNERTFTLGLGDFVTDDPNIRYKKCDDEKHLLDIFIKLWKKLDLDVVSGYNIEFFDIPYLINRITKVIDEQHAKMLSPWGYLRDRRLFMMGREHDIKTPVGIAVLDYLTLYIKFAYTRTGQDSFKESKKLDYVANKELGEKKIDWSEDYSSLDDLYKRNHQLYIEYNQRDCELVQKLNTKLKFIELVYAIAYDAHTNYADALTSVLLWDVISYNYLMRKNIVVPPLKKKQEARVIMGAYVKEPVVGMYEWVVSLDLTSLYPSLIMGYNISPETFISKVHTLSMYNNI